MQTRLMQWCKQLAKLAVAIVLVSGLFVGCTWFVERSASAKAREFCSGLAPGSDVSQLRERAIAAGANDWQTRWQHQDGKDQLWVTFTGIPPFSRYLCIVTAQDGRLVDRREGRLD